MIENIQLEMNPSVKKQRTIGTSIALFSQDIDNYSFDITFTDLELQAGDEVEVLAKLQGGKLEHKSSANLVEVDEELIARYVFDTKLIDGEGHVFCYVYLKRGDKSADVGAFYFEVDLSELDKVGGKIAEVYDGRYEDLVADFEIKLQEYRDSLPQADSVRAEIDVILNQFGVDSQAKLNQYDTDAQQAVADWEQGADAIIVTVEANESARVDAEATRETAETDRVSSETTRIGNEDERKSAEVIRLASEVDRVNAESVRSDFYEGFDGRLDDLESDKKVLKNELINGGFISTISPWYSSQSTIAWSEDYVEVTPTNRYGSIVQTRQTTEYNGRVLYIFGMVKAKSDGVTMFSNSNPGFGSVFHSGTGNWERLSFIQNQPTDATRLRVEVRDNAVSPVENFQIKYVAVIDLTATFGAGNEPTKSEMDELIKVTGYFDETTLTQKQLLNWQLKLMRQNRNALIALGGTII